MCKITRNFHKIFTFGDPLCQKKRFLRKCLSIVVVGSDSVLRLQTGVTRLHAVFV